MTYRSKSAYQCDLLAATLLAVEGDVQFLLLGRQRHLFDDVVFVLVDEVRIGGINHPNFVFL